MINARIDNGIQHFDVEGTPTAVVAEFGLMINQYCSAVKKCCPQVLPGLREAFAAITAPESPVWNLDEGVEGIFINRRVDK